MAKPLKQVLELEVGENRLAVDVTFRVLEVVERVYNMRAELVARDIYQYDRAIKRTQLASCIVEWFRVEGVDHNRMDVYESVMTATTEELRRYVGAVQGAIAYSLKEITAEELKQLAGGKDLSDDDDDGTVEVETDDDPEKKSD